MVDSNVSIMRTNRVAPICGMQVDVTNAVVEDIYSGVHYLFCSKECYQLFVQAAAQHITELAHGDDCIGHQCPNQWRAARSDSQHSHAQPDALPI